MDNPTENSVKENVIRAIESGEVSMRPKWQFVATAGLLFAGSLLVTLALVYLVSFIFFTENGPRGTGEILSTLPWLVILVSLAFFVLLEILFRKFSFAYRKPLLYTTVGIIVFVLLTGFLVSLTPLHRGLSDRAFDDSLPFGGRFYRHYDHRQMPRPDEINRPR